MIKMYYIYALIISIVLFTFLMMFEKKTDNGLQNSSFDYVITFVAIYGVTCVLSFFMTDVFPTMPQPKLIREQKAQDEEIEENVDIKMLKRIPENIKTGIDPHDDSDNESD